jgi:hypothetical protein
MKDDKVAVTPSQSEEQGSVDFSTVYREELRAVLQRRQETNAEVPQDDSVSDLQKFALEQDLCGLAISGGGIRSATFGLGVLQGLSSIGLLRKFDYLSTVSGGGYIGSWLSAWVRRDGWNTVNSELMSRSDDASATLGVEPQPIKHLRLYSNYLSPIPSPMAFDGLTLITIGLRNLFLNQLGLLFFTVWLFVSMRLLAELLFLSSIAPAYLAWSMLGISGLLLFIAAFVTSNRVPKSGIASRDASSSHIWSVLTLWSCGSALLLAALINPELVPFFAGNNWWPGLCAAIVASIFLQIALAWTASSGNYSAFTAKLRAGLAAGVLSGFVFAVLWSFLLTFAPRSLIASTTTFGVPITLLALVLGSFTSVGWLGSRLSVLQREWWAGYNAKILQVILFWLLLFSVGLFGPWIVGQVWTNFFGWWGVVAGLVSGGWLAVLMTGLGALDRKGSGTEDGTVLRVVIAQAAPWAFLLAILVAASLLTTWLTYDFFAYWTANPENRWRFYQSLPYLLVDMDNPKGKLPAWLPVLMLFGACLIVGCVAWVLQNSIGVNLFSLQEMYKNRLVRCYLGASRSRDDRNPDPLVNMDPGDDIEMSSLFPGTRFDGSKDQRGPLFVVNAALNEKAAEVRFSRSREVDQPKAGSPSTPATKAESQVFSDRMATSFVFTSLYSGSELTGYCSTDSYLGSVELGTAMAVSGAAISSNMGYLSSPSISALLTLFNLRLGGWFGNPRRKTRADVSPSEAWLLLREMAGRTDSQSDYIYLSDGGHFENTGVYELIRRRCRFIVAVDSGADPKFNENMGRLIRLVRIDFGVQIDIDSKDVCPVADSLCKSHVVFGKIHYGPVGAPTQAEDKLASEGVGPDTNADCSDNEGIIIWIKAAMTGDEPADVLNHAAMNPTFPYETTVDQFFSESQFESYRMLGLHSIQKELEPLLKDVDVGACSSREIFQTLREGLAVEDRAREIS